MGRLAIKIDVDTERGTRDGVLPLAEVCRKHKVPAVFLFSLGPDNMGRSISRIFQPGFFRKVTRTRVISNYGLRTLLNGVLLPAPHLGKRYGDIMRRVRDLGFETGIHCYDHYLWQNFVFRMTLDETRAQLTKAYSEFHRIFGENPRIAGAPGWQCTAHSLTVYDEMGFDWGSDTRGTGPFRPSIDESVFNTPQVPTTLPTLDEVLGSPGFHQENLTDFYLRLVQKPGNHVFTVHAELEGLQFLSFFDDLLCRAKSSGVELCPFQTILGQAFSDSDAGLKVCRIELSTVAGRSGKLAVQGVSL